MHVIALDISMKTADCYLRSPTKPGELKIENSISGSLKLQKWIKQHKIRKCVIAMEATGIYYETLANHLSQFYPIYVINPLKIKGYGKSLFNRTKTDKADAKLIAEYTARHIDKLDRYNAPKPDQYRLQKLISLKNQVQLKHKQSQNQLHASKDPFAIAIYQTIIQQLSEHLHSIEKEINALIQQDETLNSQFQLLQTINGIKEKSAATILYYLNSRDFPTVNKFTAFAGLSPKIEQSGESVNKKQKLSKYGNKTLKTAFFYPALNAYRMNLFPQLRRNLEKAKKPKMVIIAAIMRKLAKICYYIHKTGKPFDVGKHQPKKAT